MADLIFGIIALIYGVFTIFWRIFKGKKGFGKIEAMQNLFGEKGGMILHIVSYTVVPTLLGISLIVCYFLGIKVL